MVIKTQPYWIPFAIIAVILLYLILASFSTVRSAEVALRVNQITLTMETRTKDNVFVSIPISVQNRVRPERVYDAYYKLSDPVAQIKSA